MSAELRIPKAAGDEYFVCTCSESGDVRAGYQPDAIPLIVAAELRRIADELDAWSRPGDVLPEPRTLAAVAARLRARADHLDKSGGQS